MFAAGARPALRASGNRRRRRSGFPIRGRFACSCGRPAWKHIGKLLRCYEPRGAMSCGSPMSRGEQIANPTERDTRLVGLFFEPAGHKARQWLCCTEPEFTEATYVWLTSDRSVADALVDNANPAKAGGAKLRVLALLRDASLRRRVGPQDRRATEWSLGDGPLRELDNERGAGL